MTHFPPFPHKKKKKKKLMGDGRRTTGGKQTRSLKCPLNDGVQERVGDLFYFIIIIFCNPIYCAKVTTYVTRTIGRLVLST
jgi:hypothetical protein